MNAKEEQDAQIGSTCQESASGSFVERVEQDDDGSATSSETAAQEASES